LREPPPNPASCASSRDLYATDYLIDVDAEQAALAGARLVVWLHPIHWYSMPPLMKLWLDEVFAFGWAYGPGGTALRGKDLWLVASTGGGEASYRPDGHNRYFFDEFLHPYEQTAALAGMRWLPPMLLHGAHTVSATRIGAARPDLRPRLLSYPHWPELADPTRPPPATCRPRRGQSRLSGHGNGSARR
jgi:glutathione-regulated potassium-efflux system ancillary protein KefF